MIYINFKNRLKIKNFLTKKKLHVIYSIFYFH